MGKRACKQRETLSFSSGEEANSQHTELQRVSRVRGDAALLTVREWDRTEIEELVRKRMNSWVPFPATCSQIFLHKAEDWRRN